MGKKSRDKGAKNEQLIARLFRARFNFSEDECYRGAPMQAQSPSRLPDVVIEPLPFWIECAHAANVSPGAKIKQAIQAVADNPGEPLTPIAVTKRNRQPMLVTMRIEDWFDLIEKAGLDFE